MMPLKYWSYAIKVGQPYTDIIKQMTSSLDPAENLTEILSIRRTQKQEIQILVKKGENINTFNDALTKPLGDKADVKDLSPLVTLLHIRDVDETITVEEVEAAGREALRDETLPISKNCRLFKGYGGCTVGGCKAASKI